MKEVGAVRDEDPTFSPDELLYRRFERAHLQHDGTMMPEAVEFPRSSVDRSKYRSDPADVRQGKYNGVAQVRIDDLPARSSIIEEMNEPRNLPEALTLEPHDEPIEGNDAHATIRALIDGEFDEGLRDRLSGKTRKAIRIALAKRFSVVIKPTEVEDVAP